MTGKNESVGDYFEKAKKWLSPKQIERAEKEALMEVRKIRLAELREAIGLRQEDMKSFKQASISKIENRNDIKISTLIEYVNSLGMDLEIKAYPHDKKRGQKAFTLLKVEVK